MTPEQRARFERLIGASGPEFEIREAVRELVERFAQREPLPPGASEAEQRMHRLENTIILDDVARHIRAALRHLGL